MVELLNRLTSKHQNHDIHFYYRHITTWEVITENEYNKLSILDKSSYKFHGSAPENYFQKSTKQSNNMKTLITILTFIFSAQLNAQVFTNLANINGTILTSSYDTTSGRLFIGGYLPTLGNMAVSYDNGLTYTAIGNFNDTIFDIEQFDNKLWISGKFTTVNTKSNKFITTYNLSTNQIDTIKDNNKFVAPYGVTDLQVLRDTIYACGNLFEINGIPNTVYKGLFRFIKNSSWNTFVSASVSSYVYQASKMCTDGLSLYVSVESGSVITIRKYNGISWNVESYPGNFSNTVKINYLKFFNTYLFISSSVGVFGCKNGFLRDTINSGDYKTSVVYKSKIYFGGQNLLSYNTDTQCVGLPNKPITNINTFSNILFISGKFDSINKTQYKNTVKYESINKPIANFYAIDTQLCGNNRSTNFINTSIGSYTSYRWFFEGSDIDSSTSTTGVAVTFPNNGKFKITLIATNLSGSDTAIKYDYIKSFNYPTINIADSIKSCGFLDQNIVLNNSYSYAWLPVTDITNVNSFTFNINTTNSQNYNVIFDNNGCRDTAMTHIIINNLPTKPIIYQDNDTIKCNQNYNSYSWYYNSSLISNNQNVTPNSNGYYKLTISDNNGCLNSSDSLNFVKSIPNGINNQNSDLKIQIYPNPTSDFINVVGVDNFEIIDEQGKSYGIFNKMADMGNLSQGIYHIIVGSKSKSIYKK